ncbi:MAG: FMN-binding protein, partial [Gemmatimonadetes bacterium]|nr:FMN-binding protein [Gemmatimonadota bacterium]
MIERNKAEALQRAIFQVLPDARSSATFRLIAEERFEPLVGAAEPGDPLVYAGYDENQRLIGLAVEAQGMGYQDVIRVLYGYSFAEDAIVGIRVLESKETPGLGDRIETDPDFLENFKRLDVSLTEDQSRPANPIEAVKHGKKEHPWQVDAITGATISSNAIAAILS